ncbi:uncharacterized protein LOC142168826 [Nicotiana tabacum]|uniref:Uncharacterized protein LOC142168826 n=1 Tax=Nicotiana tabacum TaxID=4097 RepID=A0AC58SM95_TOBAC
MVDGYTMMKSSRLRFIRLHQKQLRAHFYKGFKDVVLHGDIEPSSQGQRVVLSSNFTGGACYMLRNYQDAMAICKWAGYPDLFITFTCNPKWPEITRFVENRGLSPEDRPDILTRIFKIKLDRMIKDLRDNKVFGEVKAEADLTEDELKNRCLQKLENFSKGCGRSFQDYPTMPKPVYCAEEVDNSNRLIRDELRYNRRALAEEHEQLLKNLTDKQKSIYEKIITVVNENKGEFFFLYGFGGTGKTFIWRTLASAIRSRGDIVVTVASSEIASLLLLGGRITHSRFVIPLNLTEDSTCNIKQGTPLANLIVKANMIIWDEAPMMHRYCFEALDKTLRDILRFKDASDLKRPFGVDGNEKVQIPDDLLINESVDPISAILESTHPDFIRRCNDIGYLQQRAILAPTFDMVESINEYMISLNHSSDKSYLSSDTICTSDQTYSALEHVHTPEFLNTIKCSGISNHTLTLKVGVLVMLLRNIDQSAGLCNGTRLIITKLENQVIEAKVLAGQKGFIPKMTLSPSDARIPFKFKRR